MTLLPAPRDTERFRTLVARRFGLNFDDGKPDAADPVDRQSCRPDFVVLVYAGWKELDLSHVPKNAPPAFCVCAGVDDAFHAKETVDFYNAYFNGTGSAERARHEASAAAKAGEHV